MNSCMICFFNLKLEVSFVQMHQTLEVRKAAAEKVMKAAEQERLDKEEVARKALADQEIIMEKVVQESNILKQEAEENAKVMNLVT